MTKTVIAVDPGKSGAIAVLCGSEISTLRLKTVSEPEIVAFLRQLAPGAVAYMEKVGGYIPTEEGEGQPGSRMFAFGDSNGFVRGVLMALGFKIKAVLPQVWQRGVPGKGRSYNDRKKALHAHAQRLFPNMDVTRDEADALGILHYARFAEGLPAPGYSAPLARNPDDSAAVAWCKAQGWPVPAYETKEYGAMVRYYVEKVKQVA